MDGRPNLDRILRLIRETGPDFIGFNEVDRFFSKRSGFVDQFGWFCGQLKMNCAFGASITRKKGSMVREYGNALFSRFPLLTYQSHGLRSRGLAISEPRALLEAKVELGPGRILNLCLTHLSVIPVLRRIQADLIVNRLLPERSSTLLMGDFNMVPGSRSWNKFASILQDSAVCFPTGPLLTFPSVLPVTQKDYMFTGPSIVVRSIEIPVSDRMASDHLPILATMGWEE
jgi:endonuclease/exonuclease/phosphatase family metal-dependent hydrolase